MSDTPKGVVAILADYLACIGNCGKVGGWPTTPEQSHAVRTCPKESPLIAGINYSVSNYLTKIIDARAIEWRKVIKVGRNAVRVDVRNDERAQALHAFGPCPNKRLSEITAFLIRDTRFVGDHRAESISSTGNCTEIVYSGSVAESATCQCP
jgi:hypothetical protein